MEGTICSPTEKRIAVVTGGNKGIGLEICRQLALNGVRVILTARDEKRGQEAVEKLRKCGLFDVLFHQLDVTDSSSIASFADFVGTEFGKLDILVNNAAIVGLTIDVEALQASKQSNNVEAKDVKDIPDWKKPYMRETLERAEECFKTNYYGTRDVTEALIPLLQSSISGRVVNVSSSLGQLRVISNEKLKQDLSNVDGLTEERLVELLNLFIKDFKEGFLDAHGWPTIASAYKLSKVLINAYTRILAKKYPALCINCVNPGYVKTDLNGNTGILSTKEGAEGPVMLALQTGTGPSGLFFDQTEVSTF
ncbi:salutaridine reductase-like isoform X2 [Phoenix dactylifera]|uniref:Short-chain dehydrogenase/reductase n=1 Tax=Phoenix dactylifera TaxID=42345 RepID=A0A8B9A312_PHODC|nr:salutaridine reductase-like isoform X2 [Phoenix dactylifera]